jgi:hypothetical protein
LNVEPVKHSACGTELSTVYAPDTEYAELDRFDRPTGRQIKIPGKTILFCSRCRREVKQIGETDPPGAVCLVNV